MPGAPLIRALCDEWVSSPSECVEITVPSPPLPLYPDPLVRSSRKNCTDALSDTKGVGFHHSRADGISYLQEC